ncbi:hypothetical protein UFOVP802_19 [uncultured Caudovirales phage]|uniref:Uncharacterized protein n=1 Tax=uncultured Caudovirales phage TaxID=2100421 RepID=A0A6J5P756_9CAUD|nr:hypothetical protein UFOVP802_19 [uncultured Caudovirales phage]
MKNAQAIAASWLRSFIAASLTLYMAGVSDPMMLLNAGLAAVVPVIMRWLNPADTTFGRGK